MNRIKNIISFLSPILLESRNGSINPYLEVIRYKGRNLLNSQHANYSFGGLHTIFDGLFQKINIGQYDFKNILILGMGGGSIIHLLRKKYRINAPITAIEEDYVVVELAKKYFNIETHNALTIVLGDAFEFTSIVNNKYDLIISDIFIEQNVPKKFASVDYLNNLKQISNEKCCVIYNKMTEQAIHKKEFIDLAEDFIQVFPSSEIHTFRVNNAENSILCYNTLSTQFKQTSPSSNSNPYEENAQAAKLKPTYFI